MVARPVVENAMYGTILINCNILTELSYNNIVKCDILWFRSIRTCLAQIGLQYIIRGGTSNQSPHNIFFQRIVDIFHQDAFAEINNENSKLRTYKLFKTTIKQEPYLTDIKNVKDRISFSNFRLSNHRLMIERGRHLNIQKDLRFCPFCSSSIEDEIHFLIQCKTYSSHRIKLIDMVKNKVRTVRLTEMSDKAIFTFLMNNTLVAPLVAKYLSQTLEIRDFLINKHKNYV